MTKKGLPYDAACKRYSKEEYVCGCVKKSCKEMKTRTTPTTDPETPPIDQSMNEQYTLARLPAPFVVDGERNFAILWPSDSSGAPCQINLDPLLKSMNAKVYFQEDLQTKKAEIIGQHLVIIGNACVNDLTKELLDDPASCDNGIAEELDEGKGYVRLLSSGDKARLIIMGRTASETVKACTKLGNRAELSGTVAVIDLS
jgi:hypothetical protein